ncbi:MAG TPA: ribonuclease III, partial [Limnochordia bacterium]|nr:ribonuclease III [Limnochordia bacterium]
PCSYERLEFLGDALVDLAIGEALFARFPEAAEGELARMRAGLVCEPALAKSAVDLGLDACARLGRGEEEEGGRRRPALLCDLYEAVVAAHYLAHGWEATRRFILNTQAAALAELEGGAPAPKDAKAQLQEACQARGEGVPVYRIVERGGPDHQPWFRAEVAVAAGRFLGERAASKRDAERRAAELALARAFNSNR